MNLKKLLAGAIFLATASGLAYAGVQAFPDGLNNLPSSHWMRGRDVLAVPFPPRWWEFMDEMNVYDAQDWVITTTEAGAGSAAEVTTDADGGVLLVTNDAADNDNDFFQSVGEIITFQSGKKLYFEAKFKVSDATQSDLVFGIQVRDTSPLAVANGVYFAKDDGDALLDFHSMSGSADTATSAVATLADDTYVKVSFYYDGGTTIVVAVNDVVVASQSNVTPPSTEMTVSFGLQNGEAVAKTMSVDYIYVAKER